MTRAYQQQEKKEFLIAYLGAKEHIEGIEKYTQMHGKFEHIKLELEQCKTSREIKALQVEKKVEQVAETWDKLEAMQQRVQSRGRGLSR